MLFRSALAAFEQVVGSTPGFRSRPGQHDMAQRVASTLAVVDLGEHPAPTKAIAVIQAGTGVGKSAAYASTAIAMALERKTRVIISTAAGLQSANTAANLLVKRLGGPSAVTAFARLAGDETFRLDRWETELNSATPGDLLAILQAIKAAGALQADIEVM